MRTVSKNELELDLLIKQRSKEELMSFIQLIKKVGMLENNEFVCKDGKVIKELNDWKEVEKVVKERNYSPIYDALSYYFEDWKSDDFEVVLKTMIEHKTTSVEEVAELIMNLLKTLKWEIRMETDDFVFEVNDEDAEKKLAKEINKKLEALKEKFSNFDYNFKVYEGDYYDYNTKHGYFVAFEIKLTNIMSIYQIVPVMRSVFKNIRPERTTIVYK